MIYRFVLNGTARSGKGSFASILSKHMMMSCYISSIDIIKKICMKLGWNGEKNDISREALSEFKKLSTKYFDHPFKYIKRELHNFENLVPKDCKNAIFLVDVREPEEINRLVEELGFKTILIKNSRVKHIPNNDSDLHVEEYNYDYIIDNSGTLENLEESVIDFLNILKSQDER